MNTRERRSKKIRRAHRAAGILRAAELGRAWLDRECWWAMITDGHVQLPKGTLYVVVGGGPIPGCEGKTLRIYGEGTGAGQYGSTLCALEDEKCANYEQRTRSKR